MNKELNSFDIVQNVALSAIILHKFSYSYWIQDKSTNPKLKYFFPILPLIYHAQSLEMVNKSNALYTLLNKYPELASGLNHRINKMTSQTFDGLNLAFNKGLLTIYIEKNEIVNLQKPIQKNYNVEIRNMIRGANKLGRWFAKVPIKELQIMLQSEL